MVKASPVGSIYAGTVHPGRYVIVVSGDTASVEVAVEAGTDVAAGALSDAVFIPDVDPLVVAAMISNAELADCEGDALGVVDSREMTETATSEYAINAAINVAKAMTLTACDLLLDPSALSAAHAEFEQRRGA